MSAVPIVASRFALDGGAMFGVVPRPLWERVATPDARNRVPLVAISLLVRDPARGICALVDTGMGDDWSATERDRFALTDADGLLRGLAAHGLGPDDVTDVVFTHLHFDHAGGATRRDEDGAYALVFPRATHHVSRAHLDDAAAATAKDRGSFRDHALRALLESPRLRTHDTFGEWVPGIEAIRSDGHAGGLAVIAVTDPDGGPRTVMPADLIPCAAHVRPAWVMAYDNQPRVTVREKLDLLRTCATRGDRLVFAHDPATPLGRLRARGDDEWVVEPAEP